jgi:membrane protein
MAPTSHRDGERSNGRTARSTPPRPTAMPKAGWLAILKRSMREFKHDDISDRAAALTYFGVLAIFPGLLVVVSIFGFLGQSAQQTLLSNVGRLAPGGVKSFLTTVLNQVQGKAGAAGVAAVVGIVIALWSASGYVAAFMRASNSIYDIEEGRPIWMTLPVRVGVTIGLLVLLAVGAVGVVVTGGLARQVGNLVGVGGTAVTVWDIAKWPVLLLLVSLMFAILYWAAPNVRQPGFRWVSPGGLLAVLVWVAASALFALYVANFSSYNKTYGALAAVIVFLVWLWISNIAVLLGAEINAELERARRIEMGQADEVQEPYAEPRRAAKSGA